MGVLNKFPSSCGFLFENFILPKVIQYFKKAETLDKHSFFAKWEKSLFPSWYLINNAFFFITKTRFVGSKLSTPIYDKKGQWLSRVRHFDEYIGGTDKFQSCDFIIPDHFTRHDAVGQILGSDGKFYPVICQWKFKLLHLISFL